MNDSQWVEFLELVNYLNTDVENLNASQNFLLSLSLRFDLIKWCAESLHDKEVLDLISE